MEKQDRILRTRDAAHALLEDLQYLKEVTARLETSRGELRRLSAVLRRLLIDGDLVEIAAPRIGRLELLAPDNRHAYEAEKHVWFPFFASGSATVFGIFIRGLCIANAGRPDTSIPDAEHARRVAALIAPKEKDEPISLKLANFMDQRVVCYMRRWVTRRQILKYVANVASGVHSAKATAPDHEILKSIRSSCIYSIRDAAVSVHVLPELGSNSADFRFDMPANLSTTDKLDPLLVEILAMAQIITISPDIHSLESFILDELRMPS